MPGSQSTANNCAWPAQVVVSQPMHRQLLAIQRTTKPLCTRQTVYHPPSLMFLDQPMVFCLVRHTQ